jgi:putative transposase
VEHVGRTAVDNRQFVNGVLWVLRSEVRCHDLPERYEVREGAYAIHVLGTGGRVGRVFAALVADKQNQYLMIDSTIVRAHQQTATGRKQRLRRQGSGAFPRWTEHQDPSAGWPTKLVCRFSTRYCTTIEAFRSCTALACASIRLQLYVDTA